jgi:putative ABC transport system substrate-binding protein
MSAVRSLAGVKQTWLLLQIAAAPTRLRPYARPIRYACLIFERGGHETARIHSDDGRPGGWSAVPSLRTAVAKMACRLPYITPSDQSAAAVAGRIAAFREGLAPVGLREAADAEILVRTANNQIEKLPALAAVLVEQGVKVIFAVAAPARQVTSSVPVVCIDLESDPVTNGWASSLAHPGGNVTGVFLDLPGFSAKTLQLICEAVPGISKVAVLWHPASGSLPLETVRNAAPALKLTLEVFEVSRPADYDDTFQAMVKSNAQGILMLSSPCSAAPCRCWPIWRCEIVCPPSTCFPNSLKAEV